MGYELAYDFWGLGYAKEAIEAMRDYGKAQLNLHRFEALVYQRIQPQEGF